MQKHSADVEKGVPFLKRWRFWLGLLLNFGSEAGLTTVALALAPLSFIAPLAGLAVVFNAMIAHFGVVPGVQERMGKVEWLATGCIMAGVTLVAVSGPGGGGDSSGEPQMVTVAELPTAFGQPTFHAYAGLAATVVTLWLFVSEQRCFPLLRKRLRPRDDSTAAAFASAFTAALTSGFSIVFLKVVALGATDWFAGNLPPPIVIGCFFALLVSAPLQLYLLNLTLASGQATFTIPLYLSLTMVFTSASGGFLFNEFSAVAHRAPAPLWIVVYGVAVVIVIAGLVVLSSRQEAGAHALRQSSQRQSSRQSSSHARTSATTVPAADGGLEGSAGALGIGNIKPVDAPRQTSPASSDGTEPSGAQKDGMSSLEA